VDKLGGRQFADVSARHGFNSLERGGR
jgi:hypothetical protein